MSSLSLTASVGQGSPNQPADVRALKRHLVSLGYDWLGDDDAVDGDLVAVINLLQSIRNGHHRVRGDGVITVPGPTARWLEAPDVARWQRMTPGGTRQHGFVNIELQDANDDHEFGTSWMAQTIEEAGVWYRDDHLTGDGAALLTINDVSRPRGGPTPDHAGHETGLACDLRLPRTDGTAPGNTTFRSPEYDRPSMRAMLRALRHQPMVQRILFNDPELIAAKLCHALDGHDDHVHVEIAPLPPLVGYDDGYDGLLDRAMTHFGGAPTPADAHPLTLDGFQDYLSGLGVQHFTAREMLSPHRPADAAALGLELLLPPHAWWPRGGALALIADDLRRAVGEPVAMRNWWRPVAYNARVDGAADSDHVTAHGVDLDYRSADGRRTAEAKLRALEIEAPWLHLSLGLGNRTTHVGILSPGGARTWFYDSYVP